jgi:hypothetical protein
MTRKTCVSGFIGIVLVVVLIWAAGFTSAKNTQSVERTMAGVWNMSFSPINGEVISRKGNTLGFPDREMTFEEGDGFQTAFVSRGELGPNVKPLGVWRIEGDSFSATFQLWCPEADEPCGSIVMRGQFLEDHRVRGSATVFWDEPDETRPTGFDTWSMSFRGNRVVEGQ